MVDAACGSPMSTLEELNGLASGLRRSKALATGARLSAGAWPLSQLSRPHPVWLMDNGLYSGLTLEAQVLPVASGPTLGSWAPVYHHPVSVQPLVQQQFQPLVQQQVQPLVQQQVQQQVYYHPHTPGFPTVAAVSGPQQAWNASLPTAVAPQQLQVNSGPPSWLLGAATQQPNLQQQTLQQHQQEPPEKASSEDDGDLFDLLTGVEEEHQRQRSTQQQPTVSERDKAAQEATDFLDNVYEQERIADELAEQHRQQEQHTEAPAGMAHPYQLIYGRHQHQVAYQPYQSQPPCHHGVAIGYSYGTYLPQHYQQQAQPLHAHLQQQQSEHHQQQQRPPWAASFAAGVQKRYGELPPGFSSRPGAAGLKVPVGADSTDRQAQRSGHGVTPHRSHSSSKAKPTGKLPAKPVLAAADKHLGSAAVEEAPAQYFRRHVALVDPFWTSAAADAGIIALVHLPPMPGYTSDGPAVVANSTLEFTLSSSQMTMLRARTATLQLMSLMVDDKVPYRCHWPCSATITVNGTTVRNLYAAKRSPQAQLKPQQVDLPADISQHVASTKVTIKLTYTSNGNGYVVGARMVRRLGLERVGQLLGRQSSMHEAVQQVKDKLAGDGDVEVSVNAVSLRCPLTAMRIKTPAHFMTAPGLAYFDLDSFLEMTQRSGKWQDPHSSALGNITQVAVDLWLSAILSSLAIAGLSDSVDEIEVNPDGCWRPKGAVADTWFDVLQPPKYAEIRKAFKGSAAGTKRKRGPDNGDAADKRENSKPQKRPAAAADATAHAQDGCVDLTLDSDAEDADGPAPAAAGRPAAPASSQGQEDEEFAAFCEEAFFDGDAGTSGRSHASSGYGGSAAAAGTASGTGHKLLARRRSLPASRSLGSSRLTSDAAAALAGMNNVRVAAPMARQQQAQRSAPAVEPDVIVISDSDSD